MALSCIEINGEIYVGPAGEEIPECWLDLCEAEELIEQLAKTIAQARFSAEQRVVAIAREADPPDWRFEVPICVLSQNRLFGAGAGGRSPAQRAAINRERSQKQKGDAVLVFRSKRVEHRIPAALGPRRIRWTRVLGPGESLFDDANLRGGLKPIVDAAIVSGLLVDDRIGDYQGEYEQDCDRRGDGPALLVEVWDRIGGAEPAVTPCGTGRRRK